MSTSSVNAPIFARNQAVEFMGGTGKIERYHLEHGEWIYLVEIEIDSELQRSQIGYEQGGMGAVPHAGVPPLHSFRSQKGWL